VLYMFIPVFTCSEPAKSSPHLHIVSYIHLNISFTHPRLGHQSGLFPSSRPINFFMHSLYFMHTECLTYLLISHLSTLIKFYKEHNLWISSCNFLNSPLFCVSEVHTFSEARCCQNTSSLRSSLGLGSVPT
jgi:hypothetical protein